MPRRPTEQEREERRRLFQRMEWTFVYLPPLIALFIAVFGAAFLAWLLPLGGTTFWGRWAVFVALLLGIPLLIFGIRWLWERRS